MAAYSVVFATCASEDEARKIAKAVLEAKMAACVNIVPGVESHYWWEGKLESSKECLLLLKTRSGLVAGLCSLIKANNSYQTPEVVGIRIHDGLEAYLNWVGANTVFTKEESDTKKSL